MPRTTVLVLVLALSTLATAPAVRGQEPDIPPRSLAPLIETDAAPLILDVRTPEEYAKGHVPGAILIPHDQLAERLGELGNVQEVVVYCHSGRRAGLAERILTEAGFGVSLLEGSWLAWQAAELPVEIVEVAR